MRNRPSTTLPFGLFSILLFISSLLAQEVVKSQDSTQVLLKVQPDFTEITRETQQVAHEAKGIDNMVWWLPEEFWKAALAENPIPRSPRTKMFSQEMFLKVVHPYFIVGVSSGRVGPSGAVKYRTDAEVRGLVHLKDSDGSIYEPLPEDKLDPGLPALLNLTKPSLARAGGAFGENIHFYVFPGSKNDGARICDPLKEGACEVVLGERAFMWRLPLGSLLPKQNCPVCGGTFSGNYKFCPYDGTKLVAALASAMVVPTSPGTMRLRLGDVTAPSGGDVGKFSVPPVTPGQMIQQSMQEAAKGGYLDLRFNNLPSSVSTEVPTILSDTRGVDFGPYLGRVVMRVKRNWISIIPPTARLGEKGRVGVVFEILRDGSMPQERMVESSGSDDLDRAAVNSIHASAPFPPLPQEFTGEHLVLQFIFLYNEQPH